MTDRARVRLLLISQTQVVHVCSIRHNSEQRAILHCVLAFVACLYQNSRVCSKLEIELKRHDKRFCFSHPKAGVEIILLKILEHYDEVVCSMTPQTTS